MANDFLAQLAAGPLRNPRETFLPAGKRPDPRAPQTEDEKRKAKNEAGAKRAREKVDLARKADELLAHYAGTDVSPAKVRQFISDATILAILKTRGVIKRGAPADTKESEIRAFVVNGLGRHGRRVDPAELDG